MSNVWDGKHLWIWYISQTENGDATAMIATAKKLGLSGVLIKAWDGTTEWGQFKWNVKLFQDQGFKVGAWGYCYGNDVQGEANQAIQAAAYGADWIVIDAETDYEGKTNQAQQFGQLLRAKLPHLPIGLSTFALPYYHTTFPYQTFANFVDVMIPQDYWVETGWPVKTETLAAMSLFKSYGKPVAPAGSAYGSAAPSDIETFVQTAASNGAKGVSFWSWQAASAAQLQAIGASTLANPTGASAPGQPSGQPTPTGTAPGTTPSGGTGSSGGSSQSGGGAASGSGAGGSGATGTAPAPSPSTGTPASPSSAPPPDIGPLPADVPPNAWYAQAVAFVTSKGYMTAPGNQFLPQETVTRAMLAEVLYNIDKAGGKV